jgi:GalNAc-alpha-(1->4)-GalNAc-alpha-(1->3)-diNAcBac-PP-undecaprenol alpha-1,4-N-acetyl-D-galactosaminyltransferase
MNDSPAAPGPRPRLLLIVGSLQAGGAERQLSEMANYWSARGVQVTLATWHGPEVADFYILDRTIERVHLGVNGSRVRLLSLVQVLGGVMRLRRLIRTSRPNSVLSFIDVSNVCTIVAAAGLGVRVVVAERTHPALRLSMGASWRLLRRLCYRYADLVIAQTHDAAAWLERNCRARVRVIPNALRELPSLVCEREPLIIAVGRLTAEKGFDLLLRAFARLQRRFPEWRVAIVGEGAERDALLKLREELHLTQRVELLGEVREVDRWLARASLLVHPSRREGFPNAVLEAMGMGVAVISADCRAGPAELIDDGINGRLVPVDDVETLELVMMELMASAASREALGREAHKVRLRFGREQIMERWRGCMLPGNSWAPAADRQT